MIVNERDNRHERVIAVAKQMMTAARTAPKAKGIDAIEVALVDGNDIKVLANKMFEMSQDGSRPSFIRDGENILQAECVVLIGTRDQPMGLNCAHCGYSTCNDRIEGVPCAINCVDVGIAIGSAVSVAADCRVDTRVMYSTGLAAEQLDMLKDCRQIYAIPINASSKNPFFDRKS